MSIGYEIIFDALNTESTGDLVYITTPEGATLVYSGNVLPAPIYISSGEFAVQFVSNSNATVGTGFRLRWRQIFTQSSASFTPNTPFGNALFFDAQRGALVSGGLKTGFLGLTGNYSTALGNKNIASGVSASAFGNGNTASEFYATAFGDRNIADGQASTTFGSSNTATAQSATAFGTSNVVSGSYATAIGLSNTAIGYNSTAIGFRNTASGDYSTAMGGPNTASGDYSTAVGGSNTANGNYSTAMGYLNTASGNYSTAMGSRMNTNNQAGAFMIGDTDPLFEGTTGAGAADQFVARFRNGYYFMTSGTGIRTGIFAGAGQNAWGSISDSTKKERLLPMNHADVLRKIGAMKLSSWNYKGQRDIRHYGPMAQDFYAAFGHDGLGQIGCDTLIYSHDFAGVTFAGVQALVRENERLHVETQDLASQVRRLKEETQDLASQVRRLYVETQDLASLQARTNQRLELLEQAMLGRKRVVRATPRTRTYSR